MNQVFLREVNPVSDSLDFTYNIVRLDTYDYWDTEEDSSSDVQPSYLAQLEPECLADIVNTPRPTHAPR